MRAAAAEVGGVGGGRDDELVRWYLEECAESPADPAPAIARDAEVRVEVDADPGEGAGLAWELLRDPGTDSPVASPWPGPPDVGASRGSPFCCCPFHDNKWV